MKRNIFLLLLLCLALLLTACGQPVDTPPSESQTEDPTSEKDAVSQPEAEQTLTISICYNHNATAVQTAAERFEELHPGLAIEVVCYDGDTTAYRQQVTTQLLSGTATDLVDVTSFPEISLFDSGLLADIYPLMENDPNFDPAEYYTNVFDAMSYNGQMVVFPIAFSYDFIGVNSTFSPELVEAYSQLETVSDQQLISFYTGLADTGGRAGAYNLDAGTLIDANLRAFVDFENKTCSFDTPEFIQLLKDLQAATDQEKIARGELGWSMTSSPYRADLEAEAQKYLFSVGDIYGLLPYQETMPFSHYIPHANAEGAIIIMPMMRFSINAASPNQDLAWEFLRFLTTPEANEDVLLSSYPVHRELFREYATRVATEWANALSTQEALNGEIPNIAEQIVTQLEAYNALPMEYQFNLGETDLLDMTREILNAYYSGTMTAEQAAEELQNRISLYLME